MKRVAQSALIARSCGTFLCSRRCSLLEHRTKGSMFMKHLDLYARRDPQLAPYLLREVDIEYKRRCRKVSFCAWICVFTAVTAVQIRMQSEQLHYMRLYADCVEAEQRAKDEDGIRRRKALVALMNVVKDAFGRNQSWGNEDQEKALKEL
ncbi:hypothetical protein, conserved [Trypanosoma brucei gambiense DAL972]|uniref:Uncharacterized protein n=2 Tax=Trypanosoma brucei TaxID=5691 RepID=C9ZJL1_TRYB9|nr:hypothetical protein, conserved [Trypanosoma brucei gambiense DAL972]RHW74105.1 hypothetical protein DPX39_020022700 [Trypanosoma brucei equiperdum]CBH09570.1 hypothetical protein, conserved [Trypanosoma brucei gambiense DAL972]|eukprot:XP_011771875.1 hypothetical protein, conserved [Trypanosoma brucei gambiense DAL972]